MSEQSIVALVVAFVGAIATLLAAWIVARARHLENFGNNHSAATARSVAHVGSVQEVSQIRTRLVLLCIIAAGLFGYGIFMMFKSNGEFSYVLIFGVIAVLVMHTSLSIAERINKMLRPQSN